MNTTQDATEGQKREADKLTAEAREVLNRANDELGTIQNRVLNNRASRDEIDKQIEQVRKELRAMRDELPLRNYCKVAGREFYAERPISCPHCGSDNLIDSGSHKIRITGGDSEDE